MPCRQLRPAKSSSTSSRNRCAAPSRDIGNERIDLAGRAPLQKRNATVAVIGAGDYIGGEIAKKFASEWVTGFAGRRNGENLEPLVEAIQAAGGENHDRSLESVHG